MIIDDECRGRSTLSRPLMLPVETDVRVEARDADYACVTHRQCRLSQLIAMSQRRLPRIVRIVDWDEVHTAGSTPKYSVH